ncbi:MAG: protein kinase [Candidatus Cohnella colombiensis]|uniref:Protein kinase n=1 Tax=Candidatus Cohnella colombiensis TaxID=3121368 RepID=A0AA95EXE1_9BACL|nr:MAG: protein kinase [Cohnella sp.]
MYDLAFDKPFKLKYLKTIYANESNESYFYEAFDDVEKRKVGVKVVTVQQKDLEAAKVEASVIHKFAGLTTQIPALYGTHYDARMGKFYLIMQLIEQGKTLREVQQSGGMIDVIDLLLKLCDILIPIHQSKYQHRDLKPENIMIKGRSVYLIDFNLSAAIPFKGEGTRKYQAPEQHRDMKGIGLDRVDLFALGIIGYELIQGKAPNFGIDYSAFPGEAGWEFFNPPSNEAMVPPKLIDVIMRCLSYAPKARYGDARELKQAIMQVRRGGH